MRIKATRMIVEFDGSDLLGPDSRWHPRVLLQRTPRVIIWGGAPLEAQWHLPHLPTSAGFHVGASWWRSLPPFAALQVHHRQALWIKREDLGIYPNFLNCFFQPLLSLHWLGLTLFLPLIGYDWFLSSTTMSNSLQRQINGFGIKELFRIFQCVQGKKSSICTSGTDEALT